MPRGKNKPNKSDFVRSQPLELSAAEVIAKAKEAGLTITKGLVYVVRSSRASKTHDRAEAAPASAAKPAAGGKLSASDFIRAQPESMTARQVADEGKKQGYSFKPALVYTVRRAQQKRGANGRRGRPAGSKNHAEHAASAGDGSSNKQAFRKLLIRIGLDTAETLYAEVHQELKQIEEGK